MRIEGKAAVCGLAILLVFSTAPGASAQGRKATSDRDLHILAGMIVSLGSTSLLIYASQGKAEPAAVTAAAGAAAICAGIGKELFDRLGFGTPEFRDLLNTAFGGLIGISAIAFSFSAFPSKNTEGIKKDLQYTFLSLSLALSAPILQYFYAGE